MITRLLARVTPACKDITHLASQSMDRSLPWSTRIKLRLHYWICDACVRYRDQLRMVRQALHHSADQNQSNSPSPANKVRLQDAFRAKHQ
jgi:3-methyladenine DNA glycosylase AlkC